MLGLNLFQRGDCRRILCLGAHSDDIEIGCGGTILATLRERDDLDVRWVVFSAPAERGREARESADRFLEHARNAEVTIEKFRDGYFPWEGAAIKARLESIAREFQPDLVFTHHGGDRHQDHRIVSELTWNTFRDHLILEYEIPKYDGDVCEPNVFVPLDEETAARKIDLLMSCFPSQAAKRWFTPETFQATLALRAVECAAPSGRAEAFRARKLTLATRSSDSQGASPPSTTSTCPVM